MKKVSISLVAVIAIVFAVSTAFTTAPKAPTFVDNYAVWAFLPSDQIAFNSGSPAPADFFSVTKQLDLRSASSMIGGGGQPANLDAFLAQQSKECADGAIYLCAVYGSSTDDFASSTNYSVIEAVDGTFRDL